MSRLVAVLGYSDRRSDGLHPVCAARLARAEREVVPDDSVLLSGWARRRSARPEAELMARAWSVSTRRVLLDRSARSTLGNALGVARAARALAHPPRANTARASARRAVPAPPAGPTRVDVLKSAHAQGSCGWVVRRTSAVGGSAHIKKGAAPLQLDVATVAGGTALAHT